MAYRLTPAERRALAKARANRDNPLMNYYQDNSIMQEQEIQADRIQPQESDANALVRGVHTVGDIVGNVLTGALKGLEGIYDFGAGIVGGIGGIFDDDFRDRVKEHVATDYVGNSVGNFLQDLTDQSYLKEGGFVENVAGGIGQMLPALLAAGITGGGSLVSLGTLGVSAAGSGTEEAFNDGAGYYQGLGYGAVRGATEIATEKLLGGADKLITGRGIFDGVKIAKQGLGRVVSEAINEGAEEVASELVNPLTRSIYKGTDAFKEYGDADYWKGVAEAGLVGGATSVAFGQTVGRMTGTSGKKGDINESLTEINQANEKLSNLQAEYNLTNDKRTKANEIIKGNWANIERTLQSVNADKRQALIKQFNLENKVNEDGTIKDTFKQSLTAEMPENDYYNQSVSLQGNTEKTNKDLGTIKQGMANNLIDEANGIDEQKANEMVGDVSLFKGEMTDTEKQNRSKFMKALNVLNKKGNAKTSFAILNPNKYFSANVTDGTLYIGADSFKTDQWAKDLVHEVTHMEEGTEEYDKLVQELTSGDILVDDGNGGKISLVELATRNVLGKGYVNAEQLNNIIEKKSNNETLSQQEQEVFNLFKSELTAHESELYLGSEEFIDRIIESDTSLAKKIFDKIFNTKQALQKVDKNNSEVKRLLKAEKLWLDASKRIGNVQLAKYIQGKEKELKEKLQEGVENEGQTQFNKKQAEQLTENDLRNLLEDIQYGLLQDDTYIPLRRNTPQFLIDVLTEYTQGKLNIGNYPMASSVEHLRQNMEEVEDLSYGNKRPHELSIDDIVTISKKMGDPSYIVLQKNGRYAEIVSFYNKRNKKVIVAIAFADTSSKEKSNYKYSNYMNGYDEGYYNIIVTQYEPDNFQKYLDETTIIYDKKKMNGKYQVGSGRVVTFTHDTPFIDNSISEKSEIVNSKNKNPKFNLKQTDSLGNELSPEQIEFFEDSKVRDENGNLLVMYHGTFEKFTIFDILKTSDINKYGRGHYFTSSLDDIEKHYIQGNNNLDEWNDTNTKIEEMAIELFEERGYDYNDGAIANEDVDVFNECYDEAERYYSKENSTVVSAYLNVGNPLYVKHGRDVGSVSDRVFVDKDNNIVNIRESQIIKSKYDGIIDTTVSDTFKGVPKGTVHVVVFNSNQIKNTTNKKPTSNPDIRFNLKTTKSYSDLYDERVSISNEIRQLSTKKADITESEEYADIVSAAVDEGDFSKYEEWAKQSGLSEIEKKLKDLQKRYTEINKEMEQASTQSAIEEEKEKIKSSGLSEADYFRKQAIKEFGYTPYFYDAGYLLPNGKLLNFSGEKGQHYGSRGQDHRAIGIIYANETGGKAMVKFMSDGNIRVMAETPGLDISSKVAPTSEQYTTIRKFVREYAKEKYFAIDITDENGHTVGTYSYENNINAERIVNDIKYFFENGKVREKSSISDFRFNLKSNPQISLSNGEIRKLVANYTRPKVYSRNETEISINNLIEELGELFTTEKISLKGKSKEEAIQMLWQGLNSVDSQDRQAFAEKVAEYIIKNSIVESTYKDADYDYYADVYNVLHSYAKKFNLDHIKTEIEHKYGKEKSKGIIARWQSKDGKGMSVDGYAEEINELGFRIDETKEAEIFFAINDAYEKSLEKLKKQASVSFNEFLNDSEAVAIKGALTQEILKIADTKGQKSTKTVVEQEIAKVTAKYTDMIKYEHEINKVSNRVIGKVKKIAEFKEGVFWNSTQYKTDELKKSVGKLSRLIVKNNINVTGSRKVFAEFLQWYREDNPMLEGWYDKNIANAISNLANNFKALNEYQENLIKELKLKSSLDSIEEIYKWYTKKNLGRDYDSFVKYELKKLNTIAFTYEELSNIEYILDHINKFAETYKKVWRNGKLVEAAPIAEEYIKIIKKNEPVKVGWLKEHWRKYIKTFGDPMAFARYLDRYNKNGFYTQMLQLMREGATKASVMEMEFRTELDAFLKKHSKWAKNLEKRTVTYNGVELPMPIAISLYMTLNREQAQLGLAESGFVFHDVNKKNKKVVVKGFAPGENLTQEELTEKAQEQQNKLAEGFNETEFEYMAIVEKIFNEYCKKAKMETDEKTKGYTNIIDGYYFPIARYATAKSIDQSDLFEMNNRVSNMSFNKETVKGAKGQLLIDDVFKLADAHIRGISMYSGLADVIQTYDVVFNLDVSGNPNQSVSVKTAGEDYIYDVANEYFAKMLTDIQGIKEKDTVGSRWLSNIRGNYVRFQLGLNPKTLVTQLSSLIASTSILDYGSIVKGIAINGKDVDKYSPLAKLRNYDQTAYKAEGVLEKTGGIGDKLMKPIGWMDRFTITKLFGACQVQVEKDGGAKVGTEANKIEAGKLLEQVIYETQQNSLATERSAAMRSRSEIWKSLVMFSSDAMKVAGRFIDSVGEYVTIKAQLKIATDKAEINALNDALKSAKKKLGKSTGALIGTSIFMALVAQAFRYAFAKDDEDDNVVKNMTVDALGNMLGGFPLLKDLYAFGAQGFDMDMYAYSTFNDVLKSAKKLMSIDITDPRSITSSLKDISFSVGQLFGLPTRNVYNTLYGITKRFSPETAYKFNNMLYKPSYKADLEKAIENDDDDMISVIAGLMLDENIGGMNDADARHTMIDLIGKGYDILPRSVGDTITYDDETYELTNRQKNQFKKIYNASNEAVANMVKLAQFQEASDDVKAKAIKYIYNVYYNLALQDFLGISLENKNVLFAEAIDIEKLALISASANSIKADTDKNGKQISGSRKKKIQEYVNSLKMKAVEKYMVMGYLGYSNIYGENQVKAYINRLKLSKDEKSLLLGYSGYKVA